MPINSQLRRRKLAREREALLFARVRDPDGSLAHASAVLAAAARSAPAAGGEKEREPKQNPQVRIDKVRSIFEARPDHVRPVDAPVELHVWFAFALVSAALLFLVHFVVGWLALAGLLVVGCTAVFASVEARQSPVKIPETWLPQLSSSKASQLDRTPDFRAIRIPPASVHAASGVLQLFVLFGCRRWLPGWLAFATQVLVAGGGVVLLHRLRNPAIVNSLSGYFRSKSRDYQQVTKNEVSNPSLVVEGPSGEAQLESDKRTKKRKKKKKKEAKEKKEKKKKKKKKKVREKDPSLEDQPERAPSPPVQDQYQERRPDDLRVSSLDDIT